MDKILYLLDELNKGGIGEFQNINDFLQEMYPVPPSFDSDEDYFKYTRKIESFLNEMKRADLITFTKDGFFGVKMNGHYHLFNDARFMTAIAYKGVEKLKTLREIPVSEQIIHIHGNRNQVIQSQSHINQLINVQKQITKKKKLRLDIIGVMAICVTIFLWLLDKIFFR